MSRIAWPIAPSLVRWCRRTADMARRFAVEGCDPNGVTLSQDQVWACLEMMVASEDNAEALEILASPTPNLAAGDSPQRDDSPSRLSRAQLSPAAGPVTSMEASRS